MAAQERNRRGQADVWARSLDVAWLAAFLVAWLTSPWGDLRPWHVASGYALPMFFLGRVMWSRARPQTAAMPGWRSLRAAVRRWRRGQLDTFRVATFSVAARALLACLLLALVPTCFASGWVLGRLVDAQAEPVGLHRWLGQALMLTVAAHVALRSVLAVLRGRMPLDDGSMG
jgi:hypothetical protein